MRELRNGTRREIFAQLYLDLSTALRDPWRQHGVSLRQSFDMVAMTGLIILQHRRNKVTTAVEIEQVLGIPRSTAQRRFAFMAQHGYLAVNGSACCVSDQCANASMLSSAGFAEIEAAIHRASFRLRTLSDEDPDETAT